MTKKSIVRTIGILLVAVFTFGFVVSIAPSGAEARSYNVWRELREQAKRDSVRFTRRIWQEYQNDYILQIRDANRWRRLEREDEYRAHREAHRNAIRGNYSSTYNNAPVCVYYITANTSQGTQVLGSIETKKPLTAHQEELVQMVADHIRSGQPISTAGMSYSDTCTLKAICKKLGVPCRTAYQILYLG